MIGQGMNMIGNWLRSAPRSMVLLLAGALAVAPGIWSVWRDTMPDLSYENRLASPLPKASMPWNDRIRGYQQYFEDRLGLRRDLIAIRNQISEAIGLSPTPLARTGRDGWLFNTGSSALLNRTGLMQFSDATVGRIRAEFQARADFWARRGIRYVFLLAPDKSSIYPERLDVLFPVGETAFDRVYRLYGANAFGPNFIDPRERLRAEKQVDSYYASDSHWNTVGARIGYNVLIDHLSKFHPELHKLTPRDYRFDTRSMKGDLVPLGLERKYAEQQEYVVPDAGCGARLPLPTRPWPGVSARSEPGFTGCARGRLRVLVVHDSFGMELQPYLARTFEKTLFVWTPTGGEVPGELVDEAAHVLGGVDVIIHERVERALLQGRLE